MITFILKIENQITKTQNPLPITHYLLPIPTRSGWAKFPGLVKPYSAQQEKTNSKI
ncbi:MAG: hypothetical protein ACRC2M_24160 [Planktothrix sp.]